LGDGMGSTRSLPGTDPRLDSFPAKRTGPQSISNHGISKNYGIPIILQKYFANKHTIVLLLLFLLFLHLNPFQTETNLLVLLFSWLKLRRQSCIITSRLPDSGGVSTICVKNLIILRYVYRLHPTLPLLVITVTHLEGC
jgi:hypothetical protein